MQKGLQQKIEQYKKMAKSHVHSSAQANGRRVDSLSQVIRNPKDATEFLAELETIAKRNN